MDREDGRDLASCLNALCWRPGWNFQPAQRLHAADERMRKLSCHGGDKWIGRTAEHW